MHDPLATISIRNLATLEEYAECCEIQEETWGRGFSERVPTAILRVSQKIGGVAAGAFNADDRMVGFVFGMTGIHHGRLAHWSDMLAVREEARGHHIGDQLKLFQRQQVQALGVDLMLWTADPLVARNAHFNINRLGARPAEYVDNMYGDNTGSTLHGSLPTDRFVIAWPLAAPYEMLPGSDAPLPGDAQLPLLNPLAADSLPCFVSPASVGPARVQLPHDLVVVQAQGGDAAMRWRMSVRQAFNHSFAHHLRVTRFVRTSAAALPYYVLEPAH